MIQEGSRLWNYLSPPMRVLAGDGEFLLRDSEIHRNEEPTDYSYLVFPFAKLYEGFLKQLFFDLSIIEEHEYQGEYYRIGSALCPNLKRRLGKRSAYANIEKRFGKGLATRLWHTWKEGRNLVFHYFPQNYGALSFTRAKELIANLIDTMDAAVTETNVKPIHREE
jgi:hypothetical protein